MEFFRITKIHSVHAGKNMIKLCENKQEAFQCYFSIILDLEWIEVKIEKMDINGNFYMLEHRSTRNG